MPGCLAEKLSRADLGPKDLWGQRTEYSRATRSTGNQHKCEAASVRGWQSVSRLRNGWNWLTLPRFCLCVNLSNLQKRQTDYDGSPREPWLIDQGCLFARIRQILEDARLHLPVPSTPGRRRSRAHQHSGLAADGLDREIHVCC